MTIRVKRVLLIVLDSVGAGAMPDAAQYGDAGANTLGHIARECVLSLPNLCAMGLGYLPDIGFEKDPQAVGAFGRAQERAPGKDTTTGHWEMCGLTLQKPFPTFPNGFPRELMTRFESAIGTKTLGNKTASGTVILDELGEEHMKTGYPIVYTSADSVFQIAAHEDIIPLARQYEICRIARELLQGEYAVGRVIARPFVGRCAGAFVRTAGRRDFSLPPCGETLLDVLFERGMTVYGVGKIEDIFSHRGLTGSNHASGNEACMDAAIEFMQKPFEGLCFVNLVDFDSSFGHRRDVRGYARALEAFDARLPDILRELTSEDLLIITADHGCDPTHHGTDHTREYVPILCHHKRMKGLTDLGTRGTFADTAATIADYLGLPERFGATSYKHLLEG